MIKSELEFLINELFCETINSSTNHINLDKNYVKFTYFLFNRTIFFLKYSISEKLNILPSMIEGFELQWLSPLVLPKKFY